MLQEVRLSQLKQSKLNVRKTGGKDIAELAASIRAIGLQQNLGVVPAGKGFEVVFGGRRLRAMQQLAKAGELPEALANGIPCNVLTAEEAHQASLAENTIREAMHPLDQFAAFAAMIEEGKPVADVAAAFGVSERVVEGRMRLSRVSPKLLKVYGDGGMTLEQLQAFAVVEDHAAQEAVWRSAQSNWDKRPEDLRRALLRDGLTQRDSRVKLVGLEAYTAAGGAVRTDLFSDTVILLDPLLLDSLVQKKLEAVVEQVKAEGWAWVEIGDRPQYGTPSIQPLTDAFEDETATEEQSAAMEKADEEDDYLTIDALEEAARTWPPDAKERAGAVVFLAPNGWLKIYRGLLRDGEDADEAEDGDESGDQGGDARVQRASAPEKVFATSPAPKAAKDPAAIPASQVFELTTLRTAELRKELIADPQKALVALTAHLAEEWRRKFGTYESGITMHHKRGASVPDTYGEAAEAWRDRLSFTDAVLSWLSRQPFSTAVELLAFLTAESLDLVQRYPAHKGLGDELCDYFDLNMATRWRPDAEFLQKIPAAAILQALRESGVKDIEKLAKLKKAELAGRAAELLKGKTWVPECIRLPAKPAKRDRKQIAAGDVE